MNSITVSPKFQIVIPKEIRQKFNIKAGMKLAFIPYGSLIELVPLQSLKSLRGTLKGMNIDNVREKKDRPL
ncbi:AbrB/MazE/SpoVT family DNA-binding domain-containing protein [Candidatus Peregrinibacteria bacterium]|nr:AbrB/MazE/SpoVT family DNA-binding domain-containing protein [Candidatus Peregrinibacteria bacterium]